MNNRNTTRTIKRNRLIMRHLFILVVVFIFIIIDFSLPCRGQEQNVYNDDSSLQASSVRPIAIPVLTPDEAQKANKKLLRELRILRAKEILKEIMVVILPIFVFLVVLIYSKTKIVLIFSENEFSFSVSILIKRR